MPPTLEIARDDKLHGLLWESLAADKQGVEGIGEIRSILQLALLRLGRFFETLVLVAIIYPSRLHTDKEALVVLLVEEWHQAGAAVKASIYKELLFKVAHRATYEDGGHAPPVEF